MFRHLFSSAGVPAIALAALLMTADSSSAQGRRGGGWSRGSGFAVGGGYGGYSRGYYPGYYGGRGYPGYGGYYPGYSGSGYFGYYSPGYASGYTYLDTAPNYYSAPSATYRTPSSGYSSFYGSDMTPASGESNPPRQDNDGILFEVRVPANADIWFDGNRTTQKGSLRQFTSPPLDPNGAYSYEIRARWMENGRQVDRTEKVTGHSGERMTVDFLSLSKQTQDRPPPRERLSQPASSSGTVEPARRDKIDEGPKKEIKEDRKDQRKDEGSKDPSKSKVPVP